jgi:hypothetical protein
VHGFTSFGSLVVLFVHGLDFCAGNCLLGFFLFCISIDIAGEIFGFCLLPINVVVAFYTCWDFRCGCMSSIFSSLFLPSY